MRLDAVVFDLGNTLVPFTTREVDCMYAELERVFERETGPFPGFRARAHAVRDAMIAEREAGSMREITIGEFAEALCGRAPSPALVEGVRDVMHRCFVDACRAPDGLRALLEELRGRFRLAVLSNYCLTEPVEEVLRGAGIHDLFDTVEVSATRGWMKPHRAPFQAVRERLGTAPERTLMVGDNFFADIVGGRRAGFRTALTREFFAGPSSDARAPDVTPDLVLDRLADLRHALA